MVTNISRRDIFGADLIRIAEQSVILDLRLPGMTASNYNLYSLRAGTEFQSFGEQRRVMQADATDFLRKPADEVALVSA
jgi:FixJ family two-component response regulator